MDDIEFATTFSQEIGALYREAKEYGHDLPAYSLSCLRALCSLLCDRITEAQGIEIGSKRNLERRIALVSSRAWLDSGIVSYLHDLRLNGNKGAHPEKYFLTKQEFLEMSESTLVKARAIMEAAHRVVYPQSPVPVYDIAQVTGTSLKHACYAAAILGESEARYTLGKLFLTKAEECVKDAQRGAEVHGSALINFEHRSYLKQAHFWFGLAADNEHPPSMFTYGATLADGFEGDDKRSLGERLIYDASVKGNTDAHALIGNWHLYGSKLFDVDYSAARKHLEIAAADEHPVALANLGAMHEKGWGGPVDLRAAFEYTRRSAEAGYPEGQYNLFVLYSTGRGVEQHELNAMTWLTKAAEQHHPEAMYELARMIVQGRIESQGLPEAEALLLKCINSIKTRNPALYALAQLYLSQPSNVDKLSAAADFLQRCYEAEGGTTELARACWEASPKVAQQLRQYIASPSVAMEVARNLVLIDGLFDSDGHPVLNRSEAIRRHMDKIKKTASTKRTAIDLGSQLWGAQVLPGRSKTSVTQPLRVGTKVGRNDPCQCGSGKKSKHCCGA